MILDSIEKVMLGPERKSRVISDKEKKIIAYHEAGHALVGHLCENTDPVRKITIISRGRAGGYTLNLPTEDRTLHSRAEFLDELAVLLGGRVAEAEVFGEITTGASNDLEKATRLARDIVTRFGMSDKLGARTFGDREEMVFLGKEISEQRDYSDNTANIIDEEINRLIADAKKKAEHIVATRREHLDKIANALLEKETLERKAFLALFGETEAPKAQLVKKDKGPEPASDTKPAPATI
jgi:cell division protease FtsH